MQVLAPVDGSECSVRALSFAADLARRFDAGLHVVHVTDTPTEATDALLDRVEAALDDAGVADDPEVAIDVNLGFRASAKIGEDLLDLVDDRGYDHVVVGHHGTGAVGRAVLGSVAETLVRANRVPVTVIP